MIRFWPNPCIRYQKNMNSVWISRYRMRLEDEMGSKPSLVEKKLHIRQSHEEWEQEDPAAVTLRLSTSNTRSAFVYAFNIRFFSSFSYSSQWDEHIQTKKDNHCVVPVYICPSCSYPALSSTLLKNGLFLFLFISALLNNTSVSWRGRGVSHG